MFAKSFLRVMDLHLDFFGLSVCGLRLCVGNAMPLSDRRAAC